MNLETMQNCMAQFQVESEIFQYHQLVHVMTSSQEPTMVINTKWAMEKYEKTSFLRVILGINQ